MVQKNKILSVIVLLIIASAIAFYVYRERNGLSNKQQKEQEAVLKELEALKNSRSEESKAMTEAEVLKDLQELKDLQSKNQSNKTEEQVLSDLDYLKSQR